MPRGPCILCAVAGDTPAHVVAAARLLAADLGGRVVLAHAFDPLGVPVPPARDLTVAGRTSQDVADAERDRARVRLEQAATALAGVEHATVLEDGLPVPVLLRLAGEHDAALVVTGSAMGGALDRLLAGSVSSALASRAPCPVVVVPDRAVLAPEGPIALGYDGSEDSLRAAGHAAALAARLGRELVAVHVADEEDAGAERLRAALGGVPASIVEERGDPPAVLVATARARGAALLALGTRGRSAVAAAVLGSVSSAVVQRGDQVVLLVGPEVPAAA